MDRLKLLIMETYIVFLIVVLTLTAIKITIDNIELIRRFYRMKIAPKFKGLFTLIIPIGHILIFLILLSSCASRKEKCHFTHPHSTEKSKVIPKSY